MYTHDNHIPPSAALTPEPALRRLPWYLAYLTTLKGQHVEYVSSTRIARALELAPSQIAKDLSALGIKGKTRIGYEVDALERTLRDFLGFSTIHAAAVCGAGSLGAALISDVGLLRYGLNIVAAFDIAPALVDSEINGVKIRHMNQLDSVAENFGITIGILTVPVESAQPVADQLVAAGIRAIWNFTPSRIRVPETVVVSDASLYSHLAVMYNRLRALDIKI